MAALQEMLRRLCYRLGKSTGLFEPTAAQRRAGHRAFAKSLDFDSDNLEDEAVRIYWGLKSKGSDVPLDVVTDVLKFVRGLKNE